MRRSGGADVVVIGSGSLARALCYTIAVAAPTRLRVAVVARDRQAVAELCHVAAMRAALSRCSVDFTPVGADVGDVAALSEVMRRHRPSGVIVCASDHSPWEADHSPSAWTALVAQAGFGVTLPFQARLAMAAGKAIQESRTDAFLLNGCFPDAVNPLLRANDIQVLAGVGNAAVLANAVQASLGLRDQSDLRLLAHHVHLHTPDDAQDEALAWLRETPVPVGPRLLGQRAISRQEANQITGHQAALLLLDLLSGAAVDATLPGPDGLPGGYPVRIHARGVSPRLPDSLSKEDAVRLNQRWAALDGVVVTDDWVGFASMATDRLSVHLPALAEGFKPRDVAAAACRLGELRTALRTLPHP